MRCLYKECRTNLHKQETTLEKNLNQKLMLNQQSDIDTDAMNDPVTDEAKRRARAMHCYRHPGGPLLGWLNDEAKRHGHTGLAMASALGVTPGYIHQLKSGHRHLAHISDAFARACARYLGIPPIVVKLLAGRVSVADFLSPAASEPQTIERAFRAMLDNPAVRQLLPLSVDQLPAEARKALVMMYAEVTHTDVFGVQELPTMLRYLQQAAVVHDENSEIAEHSGHPVV